jgi:CheY-like chemotaxis protein
MPQDTFALLLVEDDVVDVMNVKRALAHLEGSLQLYHANNGIEALQMIRSGVLPPKHVVLLDLNMPKMNGMEFLRELRKDPNLEATPVVVLTTSEDPKDEKEAFELNVAGYLLKPVVTTDLVDVMKMIYRYWKAARRA